MSVKVKIPPVLRQVTDPGTVEITCSNLGECVNELNRLIPGIKIELTIQRGKLLSPAYDFFINGKSSNPSQLATPLEDGDEVIIIPLDTDLGG